MPPKSASPSRPQSGMKPKSGGAKKSALGQPPATAGAAADELKQKAELLERSLRNEELTRNYMQLERDKVHGFWDITKRDLGDRKAELRIKDKELEETQDQHALELKVYKQKVKHLLYEHQANVAKLKTDGEAALKQKADTFAQQEAQLADDKRRLKQHVRDQELSTEELIKQFRLDNAKQVSRLRQEFELQARQIQEKYEVQLRGLQEAAEQHYATDLADLEERKDAHIGELMSRHEAAFSGMQRYYTQVTHSNLDLIKALKEEIADMKAAEVQREKLVSDVVRENKRMAEPLTKAVQEADALRQQVEGAERDRAILTAIKARLAAAEKRGRGTEWELEVTQQRLERVQQERDDMQRKFEAAVLQAQQRSALRAEVLERRLEAASSELLLAQQQSTAAVGGSGRTSRATSGQTNGRSRAPSAAPKHGSAHTGTGASAGQQQQQEARQQQQGSRRGSKARGPPNWVKAMLEAALHTPLPDQDADVLEDDAPAEILQQIAALEAADVADPHHILQPMKQIAAAEAAELDASSRAADALAALLPADALGPVLSAAKGLLESSASGASKAELADSSEGGSLLAALEAKLSQTALGAQASATDTPFVQGSDGVGGGGAGLLIPAHRSSQAGS